MQVFDNSPSSRKNDPDLKRIVIAITDGDDHCPTRTAEAARILKSEKYEALFIGVGVGLECDYDENFIRGLTSSLAGDDSDDDKLYVSVKNYSMISNYAIDIFGRLCDQYSSSCPEGCDAFCACKSCFCPICDGNGNKCTDPVCEVEPNTQSSVGCVPPKKSCAEVVEDTCHVDRCDPTTGEWSCRVSICEEKDRQFPYKCQNVTCSDGDSECSVFFKDDVCNIYHKDEECHEWRCLREPVGPTNPEVDAYGCYLANDMTETCVGQESECFQTSCFKNETTWEVKCKRVDNCTDNECFTHKCIDLGNGHSYCNATEKPNTEYISTNCHIYECINETGWRTAKVWNNNTCREAAEAAGLNISCRSYYCSDDETGGCNSELHEEECNAACEAILTDCQSNAAEMSREDPIGNCTLGKCSEPDENGNMTCDYKSFNCSKDEEVVNECESKNRQYANTRCFTIMCEYGRCTCDEVLPAPRSNKCVNWTCEGDRYKGWNWTSHPTEEAIACNVSRDACYTRQCKPDTGCEVTEICAAQGKTDLCNRYVCDEKNETCKPVSLLNNYTCMREICVNGLIVEDWTNVEPCPDGHNCTNVECVTDKTDKKMYGHCRYTSKLAEKDKLLCNNYTCNEETDEWEPIYLCDDHDYCTDDQCEANGKCRNVPITCYDELDMSNYPCFKAVCKEDYENEKHRCVRKLRLGSYIDICGQCIRADDDEDSNAQTAIACTDAPDEPVLKEGLAAASIALIILGAIIIGAALATSGVLGTKSLLERARAANNQSVVSNPLFEDSATEMTNPAFAGDN